MSRLEPAEQPGGPAVSILCAVHNEERYLTEMIDSVLAQDFADLELIIVNDRSTDGTVEIARDAVAADPRVVLVEDAETTGKNSAWNAAFRRSRGRWIVFLGGDDLMPPDGLSGRMSYASRHDPDDLVILYSKVRMFGEGIRYDGLVVPRGDRGSRSGPTAMLSRRLAELTFPITEELPNEDLWVTTIADLRATSVEAPLVCFHHRSHANNSFRRGATFAQTSAAFAARAQVFALLLREQDRFTWSAQEAAHLRTLVALEDARASGRLLRVLRTPVPVVHRLRIASQTNRILFGVRTRAYRLFSGW